MHLCVCVFVRVGMRVRACVYIKLCMSISLCVCAYCIACVWLCACACACACIKVFYVTTWDSFASYYYKKCELQNHNSFVDLCLIFHHAVINFYYQVITD